MSKEETRIEQREPTSTYHERKIGNKIYRITSTYKGEFELAKALEDLTVRKILQEENSVVRATV